MQSRTYTNIQSILRKKIHATGQTKLHFGLFNKADFDEMMRLRNVALGLSYSVFNI